jgi:hypothetical protein
MKIESVEEILLTKEKAANFFTNHFDTAYLIQVAPSPEIWRLRPYH